MGDREAGRALDAEVAEKVMGIPREEWPWRCHAEGHDMDEQIWCYSCRKMYNEGERIPPCYSTDIAAAWLVVEAMQTFNEDGYHAVLKTPFTLGNAYIAGFTPHGVTGWNGAPDFVGFATTAPHAICLAALKVATAPRETVQGETNG